MPMHLSVSFTITPQTIQVKVMNRIIMHYAL